MVKSQRGTSSVPLIMGIIGAVLMLPALACTFLCGAVSQAAGIEGSLGIGIVLGLIPIALGIVGGVKGKSSPTLSMVLLIAAAIIALLGWILGGFVSLIQLGAVILFLIGGIVAKTQKME
jgi:hypothetical protein